MTEDPTCPSCGGPLPEGDGIRGCPRCLLAGGLDGDGTLDREIRAAAPEPAELAQHFPDLEIDELVGSGGMGLVYRARQKRLDRTVALKILAPDVAGEPSFAERFEREARALARLSHPNIVTVYDFGETAGLYYFVMEYADGANLRSLMADGRLEPPKALAIVPKICDALQYAHDRGVVHRDIKPGNVLLTRDGEIKIADFGLAKLVKRDRDLTLTHDDHVVGTPAYMAPEQIETPGSVDHRADIYSLGVVFYEMLTGELPLGRFEPPSSRAPLDARLDDIVLRALEKERERRYQRAVEVKTEITRAGTKGPGQGTRTPAGSATAVAPHGAASSTGTAGRAAMQAPRDDDAPTTRRFSRLAVWGFLCGLLFPLPPLAMAFVSLTTWNQVVPLGVASLSGMAALAIFVAGVGMSIAGWIMTTRNPSLRGKSLAILGTFLPFVITFLIAPMFTFFLWRAP